jgi:hypothetical protein
MLSATLKTEIKNTNGLLMFAGIDSNGYEILEYIEPPVAIQSFYYCCAKKFETDRFIDLFSEKQQAYVVLISGDECIIYEWVGSWKKRKTITANLIKRHGKGGQSSVRFSRLAEESRHHYIVHCVDHINEIMSDMNKQCRAFIYGGEELKGMLLSHPSLKINFITDSIYHTFNSRTIYEPFFTQLIKTVPTEDLRDAELVELINRDPDYLLFSAEEVLDNLDNLEYILVIQPDIINNDIYNMIIAKNNYYLLDIKSKSYAILKNFVVIGKLFYKSGIINY